MTLNDAIEVLKVKARTSPKKEEKQILQWLLELRTLRASIRQLETDNERLKKDYAKLVLQCRIL